MPRRGYLPAIPMYVRTNKKFAGKGRDTYPYGYISIKFLEKHKSGPGTWLPSPVGIPFVAKTYIQPKTRPVTQTARGKPGVNFPVETLGRRKKRTKKSNIDNANPRSPSEHHTFLNPPIQ